MVTYKFGATDINGGSASPLTANKKAIRTALKTRNVGTSGSYSNAVVATATFTVTFGGTKLNTNYSVIITPSNFLSASDYYVDNKTTTTFDLTYLVVKTGTVSFDWLISEN